MSQPAVREGAEPKLLREEDVHTEACTVADVEREAGSLEQATGSENAGATNCPANFSCKERIKLVIGVKPDFLVLLCASPAPRPNFPKREVRLKKRK